MPEKRLPISAGRLREIVAQHPTPLYLYDEAGMRQSARDLAAAFAWAPRFRNYFAVKATPNPHILRLLAEEGCGADCSSLPELLLAERAGLSGEAIMFSSNDTPAEEFVAARRLGAVINLDDVGHLGYLELHAGLPDLISFRYNPGPLREGNAIIGRPEEAKFGCTREQLLAGYAAARQRGIRRFGLHTMLASNELDPGYFVATAQMLFGLAAEISRELDITFELINLGGGVGIPYRPDERPVDLAAVGAGVRAAYEGTFGGAGLPPPALALECGRVITGPHGYLITTVRHLKTTYRSYAGTDASMANLMRPGMYGAYHHITVVGKEEAPADAAYDVTGSLCENNDKFAIGRTLPELAAGDLLVIHDAGAHGHAMGFNYNGKLRSAELLLERGGGARLIRRAETVDDYFATLV
ncbi:diaminopimelate decarboxylase [Oscillochloris sp. ZM17-4]|uniref:diaminopimelate decarboxylase family protein n=1 Tax=Oscillochloris sp. ZM17-4 TaxID=2866714 RepID=UPI001C72FD11|nr:diaminopimelate decarboxylase [Oscillochloris sp. ZM17-4]MBX0327857.1 diaminopimelate decarboxylase [Oscillochloris sp. ZM17-4]